MNNTDFQVVVGPANYILILVPCCVWTILSSGTAFPRRLDLWERAIAATHPFLTREFLSARCTSPAVWRALYRSNSSALAQAAGEIARWLSVYRGAACWTPPSTGTAAGCALVALPTIPRQCAAWTPLSVWYNSAVRHRIMKCSTMQPSGAGGT